MRHRKHCCWYTRARDSQHKEPNREYDEDDDDDVGPMNILCTSDASPNKLINVPAELLIFFFCLNFFSVLFFRFHFFTFSPAWICEFSNLRALFFLIRKFLFSSLVRLEAALFLFCWCEQNTFLFARTNWFYFSDSLEKKTSLFIFFLHYAFSLDEATTMIRSCDGERRWHSKVCNYGEVVKYRFSLFPNAKLLTTLVHTQINGRWS